MAKSSSTDPRVMGDIVLERLSGKDTPKDLNAYIKALRAEQDKPTAASSKADEVKAKRDAALSTIGSSDDALDDSLLKLANKLVGAGLGSRKNPFADYSSYSPAKLTELAYAVEVKEARSLVASVKKVKGSSDVAKALGDVEKGAADLEGALNKLTKPQADYSAAIGSRDALLPSWTKAMGNLKKRAASVWDEDVARYKATFAPLEAMQKPVAKRAKKKATLPEAAPK